MTKADRQPVRRGESAALALSRLGSIATLTLPGGRSAGRLTPELHAALAGACREIDLDEAVRVVVLEGYGRSFCVGDGPGVSPSVPDGVEAVASLRVPVVALLSGDAIDAGLELALACDLRVAVTGSRLGLTQVAHGALPFHGGTQRLPRVVGQSLAWRMLLLGEAIDARAALACGLVHRVVPRRDLARVGRDIAQTLAARAPLAQRLAKETIRAARDLPLGEGLRLEGDLYVLLQTTEDRDEGISSFREKRRPRFAGR